MMLYKSTEVKVCSLDEDTDYFEVVVGVLQGDTLAPNLLIIFTNPPLGQDMTQGQFFKWSLTGLNSEFFFS